MLEVKNVSYAYKTKKDKTILNHVSATFEEGIFYTIIGPSGAGKTTLLSLLAGLDTAVRLSENLRAMLSEASACNVPCHRCGAAAGESRTNTVLKKKR